MNDLYDTIRLARADGIALITLNRPDVRNAFNDVMIKELRRAFADLFADDAVRAVVMTGEGKAYCAGVDLEWMRQARAQPFARNLGDCTDVARLFREIYTGPKPVVARVNGAAIGGGVGLVVVCDIVVAAEGALFSLSAGSIGVVPTCIAPYAVKRMGERWAREYLLTSERFDAARALEVGLVNKVVPAAELDQAVNRYLDLLRKGGPTAMAVTKQMVREVADLPLAEAGPRTAERLAALRVSEEAQEGMAAFLEHRDPAWWPG